MWQRSPSGNCSAQRSGIKDYGKVEQGYAAVKVFFTQQVAATRNTQCTGGEAKVDPINPNSESRCTGNRHFAIFRVPLPFIDGFADNVIQRESTAAAAHVPICQADVFAPVGAIGGDCKPPAIGPQASAYAYQFPGAAPRHGGDRARLGCADRPSAAQWLSLGGAEWRLGQRQDHHRHLGRAVRSGVPGVLFMHSDIAGEPGVGAATVLHDADMQALSPHP